jgi:hypothetical protein
MRVAYIRCRQQGRAETKALSKVRGARESEMERAQE